MLSEFKRLIDSSPGLLNPDDRSDLARIYNVLGMTSNGGFSVNEITKALYANIISCFDKGDRGTSLSELDSARWLKALVIDAILEGNNNQKYISLLEIIRDARPKQTKDGSRENWQAAIRYANDYLLIKGPLSNLADIRDGFPSQVDMANAVKALRDMGCEIIVDDDKLTIGNGVEQVVETVEQAIKRIGGLSLIKTLFAFFNGNHFYNENVGRYIISRPTLLNPSNIQPVFPYGYLLNLAAKYPYENAVLLGQDDKVRNELVYILETSKTLLSAFGVQNYFSLAPSFISSPDLVEYITDTAIFDSAYEFPQGNRQVIVLYLKRLFNWVDVLKFVSRHGFTPTEYTLVAETIMDATKDVRGPYRIDKDQLFSTLATQLSKEQILLVLSKMTHPVGSINMGFLFFHQQDKITFGNLPLVGTNSGDKLMMDVNWSCTAFYECLASLAREISGGADNKIGDALENMVYRLFLDQGVSFLQGDYINAGEDGECDMLIEEADAIVLVEIKKKVLTKVARSGTDSAILADFSGSLIEAQYQAGRTEKILREKGYIELKQKDQSIKKVELKGRRVERIALTQLDYFSFQDRLFTKQLLTLLVNTRLKLHSTADAALVKKFDKLEKTCDGLTEQYLYFTQVISDFQQRPYFDCWFMSIEQLLMLLRKVSTQCSFADALKEVKHVTTGSGNAYREFSFAQELKNASSSLKV
jgi:hypothetical protein